MVTSLINQQSAKLYIFGTDRRGKTHQLLGLPLYFCEIQVTNYFVLHLKKYFDG